MHASFIKPERSVDSRWYLLIPKLGKFPFYILIRFHQYVKDIASHESILLRYYSSFLFLYFVQNEKKMNTDCKLDLSSNHEKKCMVHNSRRIP